LTIHLFLLGDYAVRGTRDSEPASGALELRFLRLWVTVLIIECDVCMVNKRMILFTKRLRSKAPSAAPLSPVRFEAHPGIDFISCQLLIKKPSLEGEMKPACPAYQQAGGKQR